jgi:hypothetical protein
MLFYWYKYLHGRCCCFWSQISRIPIIKQMCQLQKPLISKLGNVFYHIRKQSEQHQNDYNRYCAIGFAIQIKRDREYNIYKIIEDQQYLVHVNQNCLILAKIISDSIIGHGCGFDLIDCLVDGVQFVCVHHIYIPAKILSLIHMRQIGFSQKKAGLPLTPM